MKHSHKRLEKKLLDSYLTKTIEDVYQIERSLDKGIVGLPDVDLSEPVKESIYELPEPKISKTPYSEEISSLIEFFKEIKESKLSQKGVRDFATGTVKDTVIPRHI